MQIQVDEEGLNCPEIVNKDNWLSSETFGDEFMVSVSGRVVTVEVKNKDRWNFDLRFQCCKAERPIYTEGTKFLFYYC